MNDTDPKHLKQLIAELHAAHAAGDREQVQAGLAELQRVTDTAGAEDQQQLPQDPDLLERAVGGAVGAVEGVGDLGKGVVDVGKRMLAGLKGHPSGLGKDLLLAIPRAVGNVRDVTQRYRAGEATPEEVARSWTGGAATVLAPGVRGVGLRAALRPAARVGLGVLSPIKTMRGALERIAKVPTEKPAGAVAPPELPWQVRALMKKGFSQEAAEIQVAKASAPHAVEPDVLRTAMINQMAKEPETFTPHDIQTNLAGSVDPHQPGGALAARRFANIMSGRRRPFEGAPEGGVETVALPGRKPIQVPLDPRLAESIGAEAQRARPSGQGSATGSTMARVQRGPTKGQLAWRAEQFGKGAGVPNPSALQTTPFTDLSTALKDPHIPLQLRQAIQQELQRRGIVGGP
jgi:hypothetical protein